VALDRIGNGSLLMFTYGRAVAVRISLGENRRITGQYSELRQKSSQ
jgi:hypothetical protein